MPQAELRTFIYDQDCCRSDEGMIRLKYGHRFLIVRNLT
jgi:hypothetical protein